MGIRSRLLAFDFDDCVFAFGNWVSERMNRRDPKTGKPSMSPEAALGIERKPTVINKEDLSLVMAQFGIPTRKPGKIRKKAMADE